MFLERERLAALLVGTALLLAVFEASTRSVIAGPHAPAPPPSCLFTAMGDVVFCFEP